MVESNENGKKNSKAALIIGMVIFILILINLVLKFTGDKEKEIKLNIQSLRNLSELATVEYRIKKIIRYRSDTLLGSRRLLIEVPARIKAGIDLSKMSEDDVKISGDLVTIQVPEPRIIDLIIEMEKTRELLNETGVFRGSFTPEEKNEYLKQGENALKKKIVEGKINVLKVAEKNADILIRSWFKKIGYDNVTINFTRVADQNKK